MANKVVENKILKLSIDDETYKKGLNNTLNSLKGLQKGFDSIKTDSLTKVGTVASTIGDKFQGLLSRIPIVGKVSDAILTVGSSADKAVSKLVSLGGGFNISGITGNASSASSAIDDIGKSAETSAKKLSIMDTALGVLAGNMLTKGVESMTGLLNQFTSGMRDGFKEYELKMNSVQTILSNTASKGTNMGDVTRVLGELNDYADQTIYNFGDMTSAIGRFTAAGIDLDTSARSIQGMANAAAHAGASSEDMSRAMVQVSQALSTGKFQLMDWKSIENANINTETLRETLMKYGKEYGTITEEMAINHDTFRDSLSDTDWLTADVWNAAMAEYSDINTELGKVASEAATKVKTFSQLIDTTKESIGSGWAETWEYIFGNYEEAKETWTSIGTVIGSIVGFFADSRNAIFKEWHDLGGYKDLWTGISNVVQAFGGIFTSLRVAFSNVFGEAKPGVGILLSLTAGFRKLTEYIKPGTNGFNVLVQVFTAFFTVARAVSSIIKVLVQVALIPLKAVLGLVLTGVTLLSKAIEIVASWFTRLIKPVVDAITIFGKFASDGLGKVGNAISTFASGLSGKVSDSLSKFVAKGIDAGNIIEKLVENARSGKDAADGLNIFELGLRLVISAFDFLNSKVDVVKDKLSDFGISIKDLADTIKSKWDKMMLSLKSGFDTSGDWLLNLNLGESIAAKIIKGLGVGLLSLPVVLSALLIKGLSDVFPSVGKFVEEKGREILANTGFYKLDISELIFGKTAYADDITNSKQSIYAKTQMLNELSKVRNTMGTSNTSSLGISPSTVDDVNKVNEAYKRLGIQTRITSDELTQMAYNGGYSTAELADLIETRAIVATDTLGNRIKMNLKEFGIIRGIIKTANDMVKSFGKSIKDDLNFDLFRKGLEGTANASELAKSKMASLGKFLKDKLRIDVKELDNTISEVRKNINRNFNSLPKIFKTVTDGVRNMFANLDFSSKTALIKSFIGMLGEFSLGLGDFITKISAPLGAVVKVFSEMLSDISRGLEGSSLLNAGIILVIWKLLNMLDGGSSILDKFLGPFKELLEKIGNLGQAKSVLGETAKLIKSYRKGNTAKQIMTLAKAFAILAGSLFVLSLIPLDKMVPTFLLFAGALAVATAAVIALNWSFNKFGQISGGMAEGIIGTILDGMGFPEIKKLVKTLSKATLVTAIAGSILVLGQTLLIVKSLSWEEILKGLTVVAATMLMLVGVTKVSSAGATMGDAAKILALAFAIKMMVGLVETINKLTLGSLLKAGAVVLALGTIFSLAIRVMNPRKLQIKPGTALAILALAKGIGMMVALVDTIYMVPWDALTKALKVIAGLATIITLAIALMSGGTATNGMAIEWGKVNLKTAVNILALTAGINLLAIAVMALSRISESDMSRAVSAVNSLMLVVATAMALMSGEITVGGVRVSTGKVKIATVLNLVAFIGGILVLSGVVMMLSRISPDSLAQGTAALIGIASVITIGIGGILAAFKYLNDPDATDVALLVGYVLGLVLLSGTLQKLAKLSWEEILKGITPLGLIVAGLIGVMWMSKGADLNSVALLATAALSIWVVAQQLVQLSTLPLEGVYTAVTAIGLIVLGMSTLMMVARGGDWQAVALIAVATLAMVGIGFTLKMLSELNGDIVTAALALTAMVGVVGLLIAIAGMAGSSGGGLGTIGVLLAATIAIVGIALALQQLSNISGEQMFTAILGLAGALAVITIAGIALQAALPGLIGLGAAALMIGGAAFLFGAGVNLVANGLTVLWNLIKTIVTDISNAFVTLASSIGTALSNLPQTLTDIWNGFTEFFGNIGEKALEWGGNIIKGIADGIIGGIEWVKEAAGNVWDAVTGFFSGENGEEEKESGSKPKSAGKKIPEDIGLGITEGAPSAISAISGVTGSLNEGLSSFSLGTNVFGTDSITNFSNGMSGQSSTAQSAASAVTDAAGTELADFQELASQYGVTSMEGLGDGISSQAGAVGADTDMVVGTADEILKQFSGATDVFGVNAAGGFGDGMSSQTGVVGQDAKTLTDTVDSELSDNDYSESGKTIGRTFGSGLSSMADWVGEQARGIVEKVRGYFPSSPAKEGPFSGMGWTKLKRSGTTLIKHWGAGMGAAAGYVQSEASTIVDGIQNVLDTLYDYDYDNMSITPSITPVLNMDAINNVTARNLNIPYNLNMTGANLDSRYVDMNFNSSRIAQQEHRMDIVTNGLQAVSNKLSDLIDVNGAQLDAVRDNRIVNTYIDGYSANKRLAPGMIEAQNEYITRMGRMKGEINNI